MIQPSLLILAAGLGSRYGGFKQIEPVGPNGEFILDYSVFDALRAGFGRIVLVTQRELEEPIRRHFDQTLGDRLDLVFAFQQMDDLPPDFAVPEGRQKPWGTGHAVWAARHAIDGPFAVINADDFYGAGSYRLLSDLLGENQAGGFCLAGFELARTLSPHSSVSRGICRVDSDGYLIDVTEHPRVTTDRTCGARTQGEDGFWRHLSPASIASMNLWGFDLPIMNHLEEQFGRFLAEYAENPKAEFFLPTAVDAVIKRSKARCKVVVTDEQWFGVTYREDRELAVDAVRCLVASGV